MSSYAELRLGPIVVGGTKNDIDDGLMWLFRPTDKYVERVDWWNRNVLRQYLSEDYIDDYDEDNPLFTHVEYRCSAVVARDRLELKGFTYKVAETSFNEGLKNDIRRCEENVNRCPGVFDERLRVLRSISMTRWLKAFRRIHDENLSKDRLKYIASSDSELPLLQYMLESSRDYFGFPGYDYRHFIRLIVEEVPPEEQFSYDLSDLVSGGWVDEVDDLVTIAEDVMNADFLLSHRVIVLTEGNVDKRILEDSLKLLYPHLEDYFHFFDFTGRKLGGGVGELANLVRAFAAAHVKHRILALFDNDTAARAAICNLDLSKLPQNISVRRYPDIALARNYPTLGPSGKTLMNVNGLAGSIELYLGQDALSDDERMLSPIQWTGYDNKLTAYQGMVVNKGRIQKKFKEKLAYCASHPDEIDFYDWVGIRAILDTMRTAFHDIDEQMILSGAIYAP